MSLDALIEAIQTPVSSIIIERALADLERQTGAPAGDILAAAAAVEIAPALLAAEIARLDVSSKRTFRRRYRKLCDKTRALVDRECRALPGPADVPDDLCGEAYYHDADEHFANSECGYCLLEVLHDTLRQSRCDCSQCNGLRSKHLHYTGACSCNICQLAMTHARCDARQRQAGRYVVPVTAAPADVVAG